MVMILFGLTDIALSNNDRKISAAIYLAITMISLIMFFIFNNQLSLDFLFVVIDLNFGIYNLRAAWLLD